MECLDNTEIAMHDAGNRVASFMQYLGNSTNTIIMGLQEALRQRAKKRRCNGVEFHSVARSLAKTRLTKTRRGFL